MWTSRIIALAILLLGLPFYFGYGNPLPFVDASYSLIENVWLSLLPLVFVGLALGWKYPKIGGYLVMIPLILGFLFGVIAHANLPTNMLIVFIPGILYLITGYKK